MLQRPSKNNLLLSSLWFKEKSEKQEKERNRRLPRRPMFLSRLISSDSRLGRLLRGLKIGSSRNIYQLFESFSLCLISGFCLNLWVKHFSGPCGLHQ
jgi:hypothetical protein